MSLRLVLSGLLTIVCLGGLWGVHAQRRQIAGLRAEQQRTLELLARLPDSPAATETGTEAPARAAAAVSPATSELLRLRSSVTRLTERQRVLASARAENERLRVQAAPGTTNGLAQNYIYKSRARMVGYARPEDTIQSFLWAVEHRDLTNVLQAMTPETVQHFESRMREFPRMAEDFFRGTAAFAGMGIVSQTTLPDGSIELRVRIDPREQLVDSVRLQQVNGQWKISDPDL